MYQTNYLGRNWLTLKDIQIIEELEKKLDEIINTYFPGIFYE